MSIWILKLPTVLIMCIVGQIEQNVNALRDGGAGPTTPILVGPKMLSFMVKALYFQSFGIKVTNCRYSVYTWADKSKTSMQG